MADAVDPRAQTERVMRAHGIALVVAGVLLVLAVRPNRADPHPGGFFTPEASVRLAWMFVGAVMLAYGVVTSVLVGWLCRAPRRVYAVHAACALAGLLAFLALRFSL